MSNRKDKERRRRARLAAEQEQAVGSARRRTLRFLAWGVAALAAMALVVALVVSGRKDNSTVAAPTRAAAPAAGAAAHGVPREIAANAADANKVLNGSIQAKLTSLRGVPVVVNQWASWCPNCKQEFPFFQRLARTYAHRVAFVGLDSQDKRGDAEAFLSAFPVIYPSLYDPGADQARSIGGGQGWPTTFYYDRTGHQTYVRDGGYTTLASLQADIQRYALGRS